MILIFNKQDWGPVKQKSMSYIQGGMYGSKNMTPMLKVWNKFQGIACFFVENPEWIDSICLFVFHLNMFYWLWFSSSVSLFKPMFFYIKLKINRTRNVVVSSFLWLVLWLFFYDYVVDNIKPVWDPKDGLSTGITKL